MTAGGGWRCEDCGWPWPFAGKPPAGAECDNCCGELVSAADRAEECRWHGAVRDDHFPCRRPGETAMEFTSRCLGETRDV